MAAIARRYDAAVASLSPASGPVRGGFVVRIHGRGLRAIADHQTPGVVGAEASIGMAPQGARCAFGTEERPALRLTAAWVECEAPPKFTQKLTNMASTLLNCVGSRGKLNEYSNNC